VVILPAFWGRAIQLPPVPYFSMYSLSFESSSGDHGPFFTFALSQQGALPISLSLSQDLVLDILSTLWGTPIGLNSYKNWWRSVEPFNYRLGVGYRQVKQKNISPPLFEHIVIYTQVKMIDKFNQFPTSALKYKQG